MPELPEVETVYRGIAPHILSQEISSVTIRNFQLRWPIPKQLPRLLKQQTIKKLARRGKYLLLYTSNGNLIIHLGMTGALKLQPKEHQWEKHEHLNILFTNGLALTYTDSRRFGAILWSAQDPLHHPLLKKLGPEPLSREFTSTYLFTRTQRSTSAIKQFIMNSHNIAGVGNIYATEALFATAIYPGTEANRLTQKQVQLLTQKIKVLLRRAIKYGGTTIKDYINSQGKRGSFQQHLQVYGKEGKLCPNCQATTLQALRLGQRITTFCPTCQKPT